MAKKSKHSKSGWSDTDFVSFWQHYAKVQEWVRLESECRQNAMDDWEWRRAEKQCVSLLSIAAAHLGTELDTTAESAISTDDGGTNVNAVKKRTEDDQEEHQAEQDTVVVAPLLNELDTTPWSMHWTPATPTKRKKKHKKQQQQKKWMKRSSYQHQQEEEEGEYEQHQKLCCEEDDSSMDEQMRAFRQTTLEHRKQWEQKKREEQQKEKQGQRSDTEEYFDASKMSFKATQRQQISASNQHKQQHQLSLNRQSGSAAASGGADDGIGTDAKNVLSISAGGDDGGGGSIDLATRAREYRRQSLYGSTGVGELGELEAKMHAHFEAEFAKHSPDTWPNIPLRF